MIIAYNIFEECLDGGTKVKGIFDTTNLCIRYNGNAITGSFSYSNKDPAKVRQVYETLVRVIAGLNTSLRVDIPNTGENIGMFQRLDR